MLTIKAIFVISQFFWSKVVSQPSDLKLPQKNGFEYSKYRLPNQLSQPLSYHLSYEIRQNATLKGHLDLQGISHRYLPKIVLHAHPDFVKITKASWEFQGCTQRKPLRSLVVNKARQTVTFKLYKRQKISAWRAWLICGKLRKRKFILHLDFTAKRNIQDYMGFYTDWYQRHLKDPSKFSEIELTTMFQPNGARRAFPCFDEPAIKARFYLDKVTLIHEHADYLNVFFNMPGRKYSSAYEKAEWYFPDPTPLMSTYLFAIAVADFPNSHTEVDKNSKLQVSLHHSRGTNVQRKIRATDVNSQRIPEFFKNNTEAVECFKRLQALNNTISSDLVNQCILPRMPRDKQMLLSPTDFESGADLTEPLKNATRFILDTFKYFEKYFGLSPGVKKFDVVYVPMDAAGMEHWGLISMLNTIMDKRRTRGGRALSTANSSDLRVNTSAPLSVNEMTLVHEAVHSWFGNRVTCDLWNNIWLNEGFTTFYTKKYSMEKLGQNLAEFKRVKKYFMDKDRIIPIVSQKHAEDFNSWGPAYDKASYIISMLEGLIGEANLLKISKFVLKKHSFRTVSTKQYIRTVQKLVNKRRIRGWDNKILNVHKLLYTWLYKPGHPTIEVSLDNSNVITLTQVSTKPKNGMKTEPPIFTKYTHDWFIPIFYTIHGSEHRTSIAWILPNRRTVKLPDLKKVNPHSVIWDPEGRGWYKVKLVGKLKPKFKAAEPPLTLLEKSYLEFVEVRGPRA